MAEVHAEHADAALATGKAAVRSAEKDRTSTCAFADRVAACVLAAYREHAADFDAERRAAGRQTVVAGICALDASVEPPSLECVAWGCGTKFLRRELVDADLACARVRDGHAEVLARRGLLDALYAELEARLPPLEADGARGGGPAPTPGAPTDLLEPREPDALGGARRWRLRAGVSLHLYSSSQPCGNASMKRWASAKPERTHPALPDSEWPAPLAAHDAQHWGQQREGQIARLVKKEAREVAARVCDRAERVDDEPRAADAPTAGGAGARAGAEAGASAPAAAPAPAPATSTLLFPPGTAPAGGAHGGRTHTCSDKICRWQCLGLQGGLLAHVLPEPLHLATATVGRKFHRACLERALCCRAQEFEPPRDAADAAVGGKRKRRAPRLLPPEGYRVRHVAVLSTAVKLDPNTAISTAAGEPGAQFDEPRVLWWSRARAGRGAEVLDGTSGLPVALEAADEAARPSGASAISSAALFARFRALCPRAGLDHLRACAAPLDAKLCCAAYARARAALLTDERHLGPWQVKTPLPVAEPLPQSHVARDS